MPVKLVIFDLGNTLIDYHRGDLSDDEKDLVGLHRMHAVLHRRYPELTFTALYDAFYRPWLKAQAHRSKKNREYDVREFLGKPLDLTRLGEHLFRRAMLAFHSPFIETAWVAPGAIELLRDLEEKQISTGLLANSPIPGFCHDAALVRAGLLPFLEHRLFSYDAGVRKPDPCLFQELMSRARTQPATTVMVGDSERLDLSPARVLGMRTFMFDCRLRKKPSPTPTQSPTLHSLSDLPNLL